MTNKIRKITSTASPAPARATYGPATAGMEWDTAVDSLVCVPDSGARRTFAAKVNSAAVAAFAGGGQASGTLLTSGVNSVDTVTSDLDSVKLPAAKIGMGITVVNNQGTKLLNVYPATGENINGGAANGAVVLQPRQVAIFWGIATAKWGSFVALGGINSLLTSITASGAVAPHLSGDYIVTKAGVAALTLAAPTTGTDDGVTIVITSDTAFAHTVTATGLLGTGSAATDVATFNPFAGASLTLVAFGAKWRVQASNGVSFS